MVHGRHNRYAFADTRCPTLGSSRRAAARAAGWLTAARGRRQIVTDGDRQVVKVEGVVGPPIGQNAMRKVYDRAQEVGATVETETYALVQKVPVNGETVPTMVGVTSPRAP